ncbi:hypothetical protein niasHS_002775 [Heterodera schachtii]|uniref:Uncharacterized protein n=1 Tax=Heterodera schachtii TaxID=97005 RepID=A0ABD2K322_HETSC
MIRINKFEPKEEPRDENEFEGQSLRKSDEKIIVKTDFRRQNSAESDGTSSDVAAVGVGLSDIFGLSEKELAKRIYQAETGIKCLYFVLIRKTEQMRYLVKARKLKTIFAEQKPSTEEIVPGRPRKSLTNFDPTCADYRSLHRILMSDEERAEMYRKRNQQQRERRQQMTKDELAEARAKARQKAEARRARMDAAQLETARRKHAEQRRKYREKVRRKRTEQRGKRNE